MPSYRTPDGVTLNYQTAGEGRPALVLIHGWASRLEHWQPVVAPLARGQRVLRLDLRGHGRSEAPADGYTMRQFADDTAALMRSQRVRSAVVVGHSMGSTVALELARRHPRMVEAVVMVDGRLHRYAAPRDVEESRAWREMVDAPYEAAMVETYSRFFPDPRDAALAERVVGDASKTAEHAAMASLRATLTADVPAIAAQVRQPVLYVGGGHSPRSAADVRAILPQAAFAQAAMCGHFVQLEAPDQLVAMVRRFMDRL